MQKKKLNPKQELFIREYLIDKNATRAAIAAGYSKKTAHSCGPRMLEDAGILAAIERKLNEQFKADLKAQDVLDEIKRLAFVDLTEAFEEDGSVKPLHEMPLDVRKALNSVETNELFEGFGKEREQIGWTKKIKFNNKNHALEMLAKYFKLLTDVRENKNDNTGTVQIIIGLPTKNER